MRVIASGRKTSRTTRLIEMAAELEAKHEMCYIVVHKHEEAYRIAQKAKEMSLNIGFPLTYDEFMDKGSRVGRPTKMKVLIDNADHFLQYLAGPTIEVAAIVVEAELIG